jgi:hypothetical protein
MLALLLLVFYCSDATIITRNGHFETFSDWIIVPIQIWCDKWCTTPEQWHSDANTSHYISVPPSTSAHVAQTYNITHLETLYDTCTLNFKIRATSPLDTEFNIVWDNTQYQIEWFDVYSNGDDEWSDLEIVLSQMSESLEFNILTGTTAWFALDDVQLDCYEAGWHDQKLIVVIGLCVLGILILFALLRVLRKHAQCNCCKPKQEFIQLNEFDEMPDPTHDDI